MWGGEMRGFHAVESCQNTKSHLRQALQFGLLVFAIIILTDILVSQLHWGWWVESLSSDIPEAVLITVMAYKLTKTREDNISRRAREIRYMNHHIRNALTAIQSAEYSLENAKPKAEMISEASHRITACLSKLTKGEPVDIDEEHPEKV